MRADAVSCIGATNLTPNIDGLAKEGVIFKRAFANGPGTNQSFPAILTSTHFLMHGGISLLPEYTTLAEVLKKKGFKTAAFHSNPFLSKIFGWDRGFDEFYDFIEETKSPSAVVTRKGLIKKAIKALTHKTKMGYNKRIQTLLKRIYYWFTGYPMPYLEAEKLNDHVLRWIKENKNKSFLLWMHYMDPHYPFIPPERYLTKFGTRKEAFMFNAHVDSENLSGEKVETLRELYDGEVRYTDEYTGKLLDFLEENDLLEDSLLLIMGDHGHAFMEHQIFGHSPEVLYNEVIHVPLVIRGLGVSKEVNTPTQLLDVAPTILDVLSIRKPKSFRGRSLIPIINGAENHMPIFCESAKPDLLNLRYDTSKKVVSCILGEWKLIINELHKKVELYNIARDFEEKNNLIDEKKDITEKLSSLIMSHIQDIGEHRYSGKEEMKIKERLRGLGYLS